MHKHKYEDISYPDRKKEIARAEQARQHLSKGKEVPAHLKKKPGWGARALLRGAHVGPVARAALKAKVAR